jgi:hypothetical protein
MNHGDVRFVNTDDDMGKDEMVRACSTHGRDENYVQNFSLKTHSRTLGEGTYDDQYFNCSCARSGLETQETDSSTLPVLNYTDKSHCAVQLT